jgi:chemotaxis protein CheX
MTPRFNEILAKEASDTLVKLAFLFTFPEEDRERFEDETAVAVQVNFRGPFGGTLAMVISEAVLQELAANMLGLDEDEEIEASQKQDAVRETLNIICGNLLPAIAGRQAVFDIAAPEIFTPSGEFTDTGTRTPVAVARMGLDEGGCDLFLYVNGELPAAIAGE